jgi:hypothetical protein
MSKMGSHDPFEHLKYKLWPNERLGVKLAIWFPTIKSRESTWFPCVQVACDILLESSWQGLQLCFRPHLKSYGAKVVKVPTLVILEFPLGSPKTKCHLDVSLMERPKVYYKGGRWWLPLSLGRGESCVSMAHPMTKSVPTMHFSLQTHIWIYQGAWKCLP